jgi:hypothetical protein
MSRPKPACPACGDAERDWTRCGRVSCPVRPDRFPRAEDTFATRIALSPAMPSVVGVGAAA